MAEKLASWISGLLNHLLEGGYKVEVIFYCGLHQPQEQLISSRQIKSPKPCLQLFPVDAVGLYILA